jgi:hypothetical protein
VNPYDVDGFAAFWPEYVRMHARPETQRLHALATATAIAVGVAAVCLRQPLLALVAILADHAIAQVAHRLFERNATKPWRHPPWHLRAELRMFRLVLSGKMDAETRRVAP